MLSARDESTVYDAYGNATLVYVWNYLFELATRTGRRAVSTPSSPPNTDLWLVRVLDQTQFTSTELHVFTDGNSNANDQVHT